MIDLNKLQKGDILYNENGEMFSFDSVYNSSKLLVFGAYEDYDGEVTYSSQPYLLETNSLYHETPELIINSLIKEAKQKIADMKHEEAALRKAIVIEHENLTSVLTEAKKIKGLENIISIFNSNIKYVVKNNEIYQFEEVFNYDKQHKLLTLSYDNGVLNWYVNSYPDGSGSNIGITLCETHDDALKRLQDIITNRWNNWLANFSVYDHEFYKLQATTDKYKLEISDKVKVHYDLCEQQRIQNEKILLKQKIDKAKKELDELTSQLGQE